MTEAIRRRLDSSGSRPARSFSRIFVLLVIGAVAAAFLPWAIHGCSRTANCPLPTNKARRTFLVVALGSTPASAAVGSEPGLALLALAGVRYENVQSDGPFGVRELLTTSAGTSVPSELATNGYAVANILTDPERSPILEGVEIDAAPGGQRLLADSFGWMASASLLTGPGMPLLTALGLGATYRTPDQVAAAAKRWLTSWRIRRATAPFFLYVDFGATDGIDRRDAAEAGAIELLELLEQLDVDHRTAIVVASDPHARRSADSGPPAPFTAVLRPAAGWPGPTPGSCTGSSEDSQRRTRRRVARHGGSQPASGSPGASRSIE